MPRPQVRAWGLLCTFHSVLCVGSGFGCVGCVNETLPCTLVDVSALGTRPAGWPPPLTAERNRVVKSGGRPHPLLARSLNCEETLKTGTKPSRRRDGGPRD